MSSVAFIWGLTLWLVYEAIWRVINPGVVRADIMLVTACLGLFFNIVMIKVLHGSGHSHNHDHNEHDDHIHELDHKHDHDHSTDIIPEPANKS